MSNRFVPLALLLLMVAAAACGSDPTVAPTPTSSSPPGTAAPPTSPAIVGLDVTPKSGSAVALGSTFTFSAVFVRADGSRVVPTKSSWNSLKESILAVNSATGIAHAVGAGSTTVIVQADGITSNIVVTVLAPPSPGTSTALNINSFSMIQYGAFSFAPQLNVTASAGTSVTVLDLQFDMPGLGSIPTWGCGGDIPAGATRDINGEVYGDWTYEISSDSPPTSDDATVVVTFIDETGATGTITSRGKIVSGSLPTTYSGGENGGPCYHGYVPGSG